MGRVGQALIVFIFLAENIGIMHSLLSRGLRSTSSVYRRCSTISDVVIEGNAKQTLLNLIEIGDRWIETQREKNLNINLLSEKDGYLAVPGCMASVKLRVSSINNGLNVTGTSDSRVALGMLALLSKVSHTFVLSRLNCNEIDLLLIDSRRKATGASL